MNAKPEVKATAKVFFKAIFQIEDFYSELNKKHFKKTYSGKPTKKYLRIMKQINKVENMPCNESLNY